MKKVLLTSLCLLIISQANAANVVLEKTLSLDVAKEIANKTLTLCKEGGYNVSVAVVDKQGYIRTHIRADGAGVHSLESSRKKAFTAASMGAPTGAVAANIAKSAELEGMRNMDDNILFLQGGIPIKIDNVTVGGIGVGGAPSGSIDEKCALDALKTFEGKLK